jgi:Zn-finger nucleic acid-binding protein
VENAAERKDSSAVIKCPRCFIAMKKQAAPYGLDFSVDLCEPCGVLWLDGGEIEALQSAFEQTPTAQEMLKRKQAFKEMDKSRLEALNKNIAKARDRIPDRKNYAFPNRPHLIPRVVSSLIDSFFGL